MRTLRAAVAAILALCFCAVPAFAKILIEIDKSAQRMTVSQDGAQIYAWPVSTGMRGYDTPSGDFTPFRMERDHFSREWDDAPMPNSIFFTRRGHAIHGTNHSSIGRPASHGCVRLSVEHSRELFDLVKREGMSNVKVVLFGQTGPGSSPNAPAMVRRYPGYVDPHNLYTGRADDDDMTGSPPPSRRTWSNDERRGVWVMRRDGSRVYYYNREPDYYRPAPPPFYGRQPWGWN